MKKILIVEDEIEIADAIKIVLEDEGYETDLAFNGEEALEILGRNAPPHLILSDIMMPKLDGHELFRRLKQNERFKNIPVIFMTAGNLYVNGHDDQKKFYLKKPFNIDELIDEVTKVIQDETRGDSDHHPKRSVS